MDWEESMRSAEGNMQVGLWEVHSRIYAVSGYGPDYPHQHQGTSHINTPSKTAMKSSVLRS